MTGQQPHRDAHLPVLSKEVLEFLRPSSGLTVVDATVGLGGHSLLIAQQLVPDGTLIGLDQDETMLALAKSRLEGLPVRLIHSSFADLQDVLEALEIDKVDAILADLGVCSAQLDDAERGLSFQREGPLDMRLNTESGRSASDLLRRLPEKDLADLFWQFGEERFSRRIARKIVETRKTQPLQTTTQLADLVRRCIPRPRGKPQRIDPATRVFQALRIAVNDELRALERLLAALPQVLKTGGRAAIISFHSLEDRLVKQAFRDRDIYEPLTRKPVQTSEEEVHENPRARSAKLRAAERT